MFLLVLLVSGYFFFGFLDFEFLFWGFWIRSFFLDSGLWLRVEGLTSRGHTQEVSGDA